MLAVHRVDARGSGVMAATLVLGTSAARRGGSSPPFPMFLPVIEITG